MARHTRTLAGGVFRTRRLRQGAAARVPAAVAALAGGVIVAVIALTLTGGGRGTGQATPPAARPDRPAPSLPSATATAEAAARTRVPSGVSQITAAGARLVIPAVHIDAPIVPTGAVGSQGTAALSIPDDIRTVGWWDGMVQEDSQTVHEDAPSPGQPGVAVIAGHVDSAAGPGALFSIKDLRAGDSFQIIDSRGRVSQWRVDAPPQTSLKTQLPPALWVTTGPPTIALVTCGGPFDTTTGHYLDNVIVWARQAGLPARQ